jgi:hypothetical protein
LASGAIGVETGWAENMNKYSCTLSIGGDIFFATLVAENEQQAREMAMTATNKHEAGTGGRSRSWSVRVLQADVEGPAEVLSSGHREA